ncbi:molybdenum cofactor biosynthesis protein A [Herbaspirillum rubrisubalbicans M1]|uniref:GTP 3',8-cyclase MoaA n=1 Tax=Herbaspirillum rubrisubalbicans TaxID=80842 RepID=UPI00073A06D9|nr:GTP 3',8-cyclase MoaA [Herbaspirillum rubrisubalbicans]ALU88970.1 molybdenum cofactor biosynthesis protein A [Herbaspirillum rubrisubalbicans M1]
MNKRVIPIVAARPAPFASKAGTVTPLAVQPSGWLSDSLGRPLHDLRISVTDRCNFRCVYCMPKDVFDKQYQFLPHSDLLSFEELARVAAQFVAHGVRKIRLTGGEPLLRKNIETLIALLAALRAPDGQAIDLTLTTNGTLLKQKAQALKDAGLQRVTVSLDSLDDASFRRMNDVDFPVARVLEGIEAAHAAGLGPIKINMVVKKGVNDDQILPMARYFKGTPTILRFIEYMDVGSSNGWCMDEVLPSREVVRRISAELPLQALDPNYTGETAERWRYVDGSGEIGVISSVTQAFCQDCSRARLSTEGKVYTCLFASQGHDLRSIVRNGGSDAEIAGAIAALWGQRGDRYSELRSAMQATPARKVEMSYIGG